MKDFDIAIIIASIVVIKSFIFVCHMPNLYLQYIFDYILSIGSLKSDFYIVNEHI